ncbi:MAG: ABC transporter ATP-binding protein [Azorhizobium sp. 32-67-21]|nr:MAG: ABC transporter ATP-binding protein [Azorhizobium sp. 32-67-21]OYY12883.1 MAG: ABC transporter ATP-binding protein [Rhizobiales bacterium 35-68-8]
MANEILALSGVHAFYGDSHVLHGIDFALRKGSLLGLLGRNGAGKTTCMSTIMGFLSPKGGTIALDGQKISGATPEAIARKGVCLVPQGRRIFRSLTVKENLQVAERQVSDTGNAWTLARVFEIFPRLKERQGQFAGSLSGGEQQMLAIGRALMGNPRVLLMDEPSEGLAPQIVADVGRTIAMLKAEGLSIILVEQNIKMTLNLADDIVIINTGQVVFSGPVAEVVGDQALISHHLGVF